MTRYLSLVLLALCSGCAGAHQAPKPPVHQPGRATPEATPEKQLEKAEQMLRQSQYDQASKAFSTLLGSKVNEPALLGLAESQLRTGKYEEAERGLRALAVSGGVFATRAATLRAKALRAAGNLEAAEAALRPVTERPEARAARLLLGEILLEQGKREQAEPVLMTLIDDYNADRITKNDGPGLAMVGRAAYLLRAPRDANDAFNLAEQAQKGHIPTLLWRAELFLDKHDPGHAEEVVREILNIAPRHPKALVWLAQVRLAQALDFDEAERLARKALEVNPRLTGAFSVLAGVALRDMELGEADARVNAGLEHRPDDLELLSMRAAVRFLQDDEAGFEQATRAVLKLNPTYSRVYQIVGEYAEWEHRYDDIVRMMEEAVRIDPGDANAHASLGLNLIRAGEDDAGIVSLRTAFDLDPYNVRVFNTLNLYEKEIPEDYVSVERGRFRIRYPKAEEALLDRYVPDLLDRAFDEMVDHYGFTPETPVGVELYRKREQFAVRTSGLPQTAIQGVCFGRTLASMSLGEEKFNLGMTLWHELAHVFHIQLSKYHVPRWFTEGLAEYETLAKRPEWSREHDPDLFEALRSHRIPAVASMSQAFTRAEQMSDVATAYYASSKILTMLVEQFGMPKVRSMLREWGAGERTDQVISKVLGESADELDTRFRRHTEQALARYREQFVPPLRAESPDKLKARLEASPKDPKVLLRVAYSEWQAGRGDSAQKILADVLSASPESPDALYLAARLALESGKAELALREANRLVEARHDGHWTEMLRAEALFSDKRYPEAQKALTRAYEFDPTQAEPLSLLVRMARGEGREDDELGALFKLARLEEHNGVVYARLFELLAKQERYQELVELGEAGLWSDLSNFDIHYYLSRALKATGQTKRALFELESAALCDGTKERKLEAHLELLRQYRRMGQAKKAAAQADLVRKLDPENSELKRLGL